MTIDFFDESGWAEGALGVLNGMLQERRTLCVADKDSEREVLDQRIWQEFGTTGAVMFTDLSGFTHLAAEFGIVHFLQVIYEAQRLFKPVCSSLGGRVVKTVGDSFLLLFPEVSNAVEAAHGMFSAAREYNQICDAHEKVAPSIGIGFGRVLVIGAHEVFGVEVNRASILGEDTATPWQLLITDAALQQLPADTRQQASHCHFFSDGSDAYWLKEDDD